MPFKILRKNRRDHQRSLVFSPDCRGLGDNDGPKKRSRSAISFPGRDIRRYWRSILRTSERNEFPIRPCSNPHRANFLGRTAAPAYREILVASGCRVLQLTEIREEFTRVESFVANLGNRASSVPR